MIPTSGSCPGSDDGQCSTTGAPGFSLLELLIVLALTSMVVALVVPRLSQTVAAIGRSGDRAEVVRQLQELPMRARRQAAAIAAPERADLSSLMELPEGWRVVALTPLLVRENGICGTADVQVQVEGLIEKWRIETPDCTVSDGR